MDICSIYRNLLDKWLHTIQKHNDRSTDMFQYFQKGLLKKSQMDITYDDTIALIITEKINKLNLNKIGIAVNTQKSQILNDYLLITKSLCENLFINRRDVAFIIQKIPIDLEQIMKFVNSCVSPIQQRWKNFILFPMNIFWFIIPYKGIDQSLQIMVYETTKFCCIMEKEKQIEDYIAYLKKHNNLEQTVLQQSTLLQSHLYRSYQINSTAADSQISMSSAQLFGFPSISFIQQCDQSDSFELSF